MIGQRRAGGDRWRIHVDRDRSGAGILARFGVVLQPEHRGDDVRAAARQSQTGRLQHTGVRATVALRDGESSLDCAALLDANGDFGRSTGRARIGGQRDLRATDHV